MLMNTSPHIVHVVLMCLNSFLQQFHPLCVLLVTLTVRHLTYHILIYFFLVVSQYLFSWVLHCLDEFRRV